MTIARCPFPTIDIYGLDFAAGTLDEITSFIVQSASAKVGGWVVTPNTDILKRWTSDAAFRDLVSNVDVFTADGTPIVWASVLQGTPLPERVAGSDLFVSVTFSALQANLRVMLIGGNPGVAEKATELFSQKTGKPGLLCWNCPPFGFEKSKSEFDKIADQIVSFKPNIIFVGLGSPKQEELIGTLRVLSPESWWLGVGVSFSFLTMDVKRAPLWMQRSGLEWIHRFVQEPRRLAKRYLLTGIPFALRLLIFSFVRRFAGWKTES